MKRAIILTLVSVLILSSVTPIISLASEKGEIKWEEIVMNQTKALDDADNFEAAIEDDSLYMDSYAGSYIADDGTLVVCYVDRLDEIQKTYNFSNAEFRKVEHSLRLLESTYEEFKTIMGKYGIQSVGLNHRDNGVNVTLTHRDGLDEIKKLFDCRAVIFHDANPDIIPTLTESIYNGNPAGTSSGTKSFTVGCKATSLSTGKTGFLIPGHVNAQSGTTVFYNGANAQCGWVRQSKFGGSVDATFVEANNTTTPTMQFMNGDTYLGLSVQIHPNPNAGYGLRVGLYVDMYGWKSGKSRGRVTDVSYNDTVSGVSLSDMVKCDYVAIPGDSGGGVVFDRYNGSASTIKCVMGLQSFSGLSSGQWVTGSYSVFSRIDYICADLGLTG